MKLIVFGGAGFIGSEFARQAVHSDIFNKVSVVDALTYAGNQENLRDISNSTKFDFIHADILDSKKYEGLIDSETFSQPASKTAATAIIIRVGVLF